MGHLIAFGVGAGAQQCVEILCRHGVASLYGERAFALGRWLKFAAYNDVCADEQQQNGQRAGKT